MLSFKNFANRFIENHPKFFNFFKQSLKKTKGFRQSFFKRLVKRYRHSPLAVALYDGRGWFMVVLTYSGGKWHARAPWESDSSNGRQIARALLDAAADAGAYRLRFLLSADPRVLTIEAYDELFAEELHSALLYEAKGELGADAEGMRFAAAKASSYDMGAGHYDLLASGFEIERIERFIYDAQRSGLEFEAVGSLESALLCWHSARVPERRLLFVRRHTSFYVVPAGDNQAFLTAILPLGLDTIHGHAVKERAERVKTRLAAHKEVPLTVIVAGHETAGCRAEIEPLLGGAKDIDVRFLAGLISEAALLAAQGEKGGADSGCGLIGMPPPPRDPNRHGTVIFFLVVLTALAWVGLQRHSYLGQIREAHGRLEKWEKLESARASAGNNSQRLLDKVNRERAWLRLFSGNQPLPEGILPILEAVAKYMPEYSRLESIRQIEGGLEIVGVTRWQEGLSRLDEGLRQAAASKGMRREFGGLKMMEKHGMQRFSFVIRFGEAKP